MMTRLYVYLQWIMTFLSIARIGAIAFLLEQNQYRILGECTGGVNDQGQSPLGTPAGVYCSSAEGLEYKDLDQFIMLFAVGLTIDWVLQNYLYFVLWRFYTKMRLYPEKINNIEALTLEEELDEV